MNYEWPGNIRELANVIERAQILAEGDTITPDDLPDAVVAAAPSPLPAVEEPDSKKLRDIERHSVNQRQAVEHQRQAEAVEPRIDPQPTRCRISA